MRTLVFFALVCAGCSSQELVVVHVSGTRAGLSNLGVTARLDGRDSMDYEQFPPATLDFGLVLPVGARGNLQVEVGGFKDTCLYSSGSAQSDVGDGSRVDLDLALSVRPGSGC